MILDAKLAGILSNFCADVAKGFFAATFITPALSETIDGWEVILILTKGLFTVTMFLLAAWKFAKLEEGLK